MPGTVLSTMLGTELSTVLGIMLGAMLGTMLGTILGTILSTLLGTVLGPGVQDEPIQPRACRVWWGLQPRAQRTVNEPQTQQGNDQSSKEDVGKPKEAL